MNALLFLVALAVASAGTIVELLSSMLNVHHACSGCASAR